MKTPYLIQRAEVKTPFVVGGRISEVLSLDYMGSAEFEFGATAKSLRALQENKDNIKLSVDNRIVENEKSLRIVHTFSDEEYEKYFDYLLQLRSDKLRLKERSQFNPGRQGSTNAWWDIENHVFWSFHKPLMNNLSNSLIASWDYMDKQK